MDLFSLAAKLSLDSSDYTKGIGNAEGMLHKLGEGAKKIGVAMGATLTAAAGAVAGMTKQAVEAYAQFEQLKGGVETLFKTSSDTVMENAQKAFETAGMSANEYMETVTAFSASLIQSTGRGAQTDLEELKSNLDEEYNATKRSLEDQYDERKAYWDERIRLTKKSSAKEALKKERDEELKNLKRQNEDTLAEMKKHNKQLLAEAEAANNSSETSEESLARAAELADMAVIDMSDNANKMGTDISAIQNAYSGFAKQNYTMLDNLKLGYGGTKSEMERLLKDAEKLTGKKYDISSYADIVEAIHAIQTEMGITGTTAEEAEKTIEGSSKAMKSAWENLLVSFADPKGNTKKATQNLVKTAKSFFKNIMPVITQAISSIGDFIADIAPIIGEELPKIIVDIAPKLWDAGKKLVSGLIKGVISAIKKVKWPTWADVKAGISKAWQTIKNGFSSIAKLIFGETEDGGIKWPTSKELWEKVKGGLKILWNGIKSAASEVLKLVFGEDEDGNVKWPTPEELYTKVKDGLSTLWNGIRDKAKDILKLIFGEDEDGGIKFPTAEEIWSKLEAGLKLLWAGIKGFAHSILKFVFGEDEDGGIKFPTAAEMWEKIKDALKKLWHGITIFAKGILKLIFGEDSDGGIKFPTAEELWNKIKTALTNLWNSIKTLAKSILTLTLGDFKLPSIATIRNKIKTWWENVKSGIALALGFTVNTPKEVSRETDDNGNTVIKYEGGGTGYENADGGGGAEHSFAKGNWNVPYDMMANIHRGEAVLTASQARQYREGNTGGIDMNSLFSGIVSAVKEGLVDATVNSYMDGKKVTKETNRVNRNTALAGRFRTV